MQTLVKERGIIFNGEMVRAEREGRKNQTRRIVKTPKWAAPNTMELDPHSDGILAINEKTGCFANIKCPYGVPGDRLWIKEWWRIEGCATPAVNSKYAVILQYKADGKNGVIPTESDLDQHLALNAKTKWRPPLFMNRWASRVTLEVNAVRVERVQDITPMDCIGEGCPYPDRGPDACQESRQINWFWSLWDSINLKRGHGWDVNDYVWVVEFKRIGEGE